MRRALLCLLLLLPARVHAENSAALSARALLDRGEAARAIPGLKQAIQAEPGDKTLRLLLVRAYLDDHNDFWALRTAATTAQMHPDDCDLQLWLGWIQLRLGALDQARGLLDGACAGWEPDQARRDLLMAMLDETESPEQARQHLQRARAARVAYAEDRAALAHLTARLEPGYLPPVSGRVEVSLGWASNARAGSPTDPASRGEGESSPLAQTTTWVRLVVPTHVAIRPSLELEARALGYEQEAGRDFSYLTLGGRPGVLLGRHTLLAYRYEAMLLAGGDRYATGPLWFSEAHRGELELEPLAGLTVFGGVGHRGYRDMGRSRLEMDGGLGGGFEVNARVRLVGALSGRYQDAKWDAYDLRGATLLTSAEMRLPRRWSLRAGVLASVDVYPRSAGAFDAAKPTTDRRDLLLKVSASGFTPVVDPFKLGLTYELSRRESTADPYDYTDHRLLAKLIWTFTADPGLPAGASPTDHVALPYGFGSAELAERVQDLLRQDEAAQRSSSCVE